MRTRVSACTFLPWVWPEWGPECCGGTSVWTVSVCSLGCQQFPESVPPANTRVEVHCPNPTSSLLSGLISLSVSFKPRGCILFWLFILFVCMILLEFLPCISMYLSLKNIYYIFMIYIGNIWARVMIKQHTCTIQNEKSVTSSSDQSYTFQWETCRALCLFHSSRNRVAVSTGSIKWQSLIVCSVTSDRIKAETHPRLPWT